MKRSGDKTGVEGMTRERVVGMGSGQGREQIHLTEQNKDSIEALRKIPDLKLQPY